MKPGILVLGRKRPGFDLDWAAHVVSELDTFLASAPYDAFRPVVDIVDEATLRTGVAECIAAGADCLLVVQPTMSDGNLAATLAQLWNSPVVLWATPEKQTGAMISACSLVGAHTFGSTLRQLGCPFELVYGMPGDEATGQELNRTLQLISAYRWLHGGRVGLIGYHAPGFIDMQADPFQLKTGLGLQLRHFGLTEFISLMDGFSEGEVSADLARVRETGMRLAGVREDELPVASRYYLAMRELMTTSQLDALAIRCWSELPNLVGQWPYFAIVRLGTEGQAVACEGDVDGAVSLLVGGLLGLGQIYLSDWLEHDHETVTLWHAGNAPLGLCEPVESEFGPRIARHFNNRKPAVIDANLRAGMPITVFRIWRCDNVYHLAAFEGETIEPKRLLMGTNGLARIDGHNVCELFDELLHAGMPHHVAVSEGHHVATLRRFARLMGIDFVG